MPEYPDDIRDVIQDSQAEVGGRTITNGDDLRALDISEQILKTLKKIEYHLALMTDVDLNS